MKRQFIVDHEVARDIERAAARCRVPVEWLVNEWLKGDARDTLGDPELEKWARGALRFVSSEDQPQLTMQPHEVSKLFAETEMLVKFFEQRAAKRKGLDEGNEVMRYLTWSPVLSLLKSHASASAVTIDVPKLEKRVTKLHEHIRGCFKEWKPGE